MILRRVAVVAVASTVLAMGCSNSGTEPDEAAFCVAFEDLSGASPFEALAVATPEEMRDAFEDLRSRVAAIAEPAPADVAVQADRYLRTVERLIELLDGVGFDPRFVDTLDYNAAQQDYNDAGVSLSRAATATCG